MMMEGADSSTSLMKRISVLTREPRPYSARYVPASTPIGEPIRMPSKVMTALPYNALDRPPWLPGGGVISVNKCHDMADNPCDTSVQRIAPRHASPVNVASSDSVNKSPFLIFRNVRRLMRSDRDL